MIEYPLINKKLVKTNKAVKIVQKQSLKSYRTVKGHYPKAKIGKVVKLRSYDSFLDLTNNDDRTKDLEIQDMNEILQAIENRNLCGLSGGGHPTFQKIQTLLNSNAKDKYLIINGVECDPGLLHDEWLLDNHQDEIQKGIKLLANNFNFKEIILATKSERANTVDYQAKTVPNRYPMGAERILINEVLGISLSKEEIPASKGILVLNVQTIYAIYETIFKVNPSEARFISVVDFMAGEAVIVRVNIGESVIEIVKKVFPNHTYPSVYFGGGIMMAKVATHSDQVSYKTNIIVCGPDISYNPETKCKHCGGCTKKCPMDLKVMKMVQKVEKKDLSNISEFKPHLCLNCGTCTYFCRAGKNVSGIISGLSDV